MSLGLGAGVRSMKYTRVARLATRRTARQCPDPMSGTLSALATPSVSSPVGWRSTDRPRRRPSDPRRESPPHRAARQVDCRRRWTPRDVSVGPTCTVHSTCLGKPAMRYREHSGVRPRRFAGFVDTARPTADSNSARCTRLYLSRAAGDTIMGRLGRRVKDGVYGLGGVRLWNSDISCNSSPSGYRPVSRCT